MHSKGLLFLTILLIAFLGCSYREAPSLERITKSGEFFGSIVQVDVCYAPHQKRAAEDAIDEIWSRFSDIHSRLSIYDPASDMSRINRAYPDAVTVGADTWMLMKESLYYHQLSSGEFDITVLPLLRLWKDGEKKGHVPTENEIRSVQKSMGTGKFELLPDNRVRRLDSGTRLTIDSIADGFAGDEAARILRAHGLSRFLTDTTGEIFASGTNCDGKPWRIGVKDPFDPTGSQMTDVLKLKDAAVTTSGNYEKFYMIDHKRYSHIISPRTGFPRNEIVSATVIAPSTEFSDFLSTTLCLLEPHEGVELVDSLGDGYACMVLVDEGHGHLIKKVSRNYSRYK